MVYWQNEGQILNPAAYQQKAEEVHEGQMSTLFYEMVALIHEAWIKPKLRTYKYK